MSRRNSETYKKIFAGIVVATIGVMGFSMFYSKSDDNQKANYTREQSRDTIDLARTEFVNNLKHGSSFVDAYMGGNWTPMVMPIQEKYKDLLKEKVLFIKDGETLTDYQEAVVMDIYSTDAFPTVSAYLKHHAKELQKRNKDGKIKILHDGDKGIIYQWALFDENKKTTYLEFGKVEKTNEGILSIKYLNKGTENLEHQRQCAIKLFTKI